MIAQPTFWDAPPTALPPHRRAKSSRRCLTLSPPLDADRMTVAQWASRFLKEHASAIKSEGRAKCDYHKAVRLHADLDEQKRLLSTWEAEQTRLTNLYLTLCTRLA